MPTPISPDAGDGTEIAEPACTPFWNNLRPGRWRQAHGPARVEETLARDSVAIATANVKAGTALE